MAGKHPRQSGGSRPRFWNLSIFWQHLLMMVCVLVMAISALWISNSISVRSLTQRSLLEMETEFTHDCQNMATSMYMTYAIPTAIESTRYYNYIRGETSGTLDKKYAAVVAYIGNALHNQVYLRGENVECLVYLPGVNSICTSSRTFFVAETCFQEYMVFPELTTPELIDILGQKQTVRLLPLQPVQIGGNAPQNCMALVISPMNSALTIMTLYSEAHILDALRMDALPEGACLRITSATGEVLLEHSTGRDYSAEESGYALSATLAPLQAEASLWIPRTYFETLHRSSEAVGWALIGVTALLGIGLSILFSRLSVLPLRHMISAHSENPEKIREHNELRYLNRLITDSRQEVAFLQRSMAENHLARGLTGGILTQEDWEQIRQGLGVQPKAYRVAVISVSKEDGSLLVSRALPEYLPEGFFLQPVNTIQTGLFFADTEENVQKLRASLERFRQEVLEEGLRLSCGISARTEDFCSFHVAVRQAHIALQREAECVVYSGSGGLQSISWLQYETLYQRIASNDEAGIGMLLKQIAGETHEGRETFYSIRFMLRSAAAEIGLPFSEEEIVHYDPAILPGENILCLERMLQNMFAKIRRKQSGETDNLAEQIRSWIQENCGDYSLCAASCGAHFGLSEKRIYSTVRSVTGMSFNKYLVYLRMEKARRLLLTTRDSIAAVAERCGYQALNTFYRVFKQYYGITPAEMRGRDGQTGSQKEN